MPVPRGEVKSEFYSVLLTGGSHFADHIAFSALPGTCRHRMVREPGRPEAEPVVMPGGDDHHFHAGIANRADPLAGVESCRVKERRIFVPLSPLVSRKGVDAKMEKGDEFEALPGKLVGRRGDQCRLLNDLIRCFTRLNGHVVVPDINRVNGL